MSFFMQYDMQAFALCSECIQVQNAHDFNVLDLFMYRISLIQAL